MQNIKEYFARLKQRKHKRLIKRRQLVKSGQLSSLGKGYWAEKHFNILKTYVKMVGMRSWDVRLAVAPGVCRICGVNPIQCAYHIVPAQEGSAAKYEIENLTAACNSCNDGEHWHRRKYVDKHKQIFGAVWYDAMVERLKVIKKYSEADHREKYRYFFRLVEGLM